MSRLDILVGALAATILMALLMPLAAVGVDFHHDGIMLKPALDVLSGQTLFRDTFTQYGALTTYLQVASLWIQPSLLALRLMTVALYGLILFFLYASWRQLLPRSLTLLSCGLFILFIPLHETDPINGNWWFLAPWSSVFALLFQSVGIFALFRIICGDQPARWGVVLGIACACAFWCRQPVGILMFVSIVTIGLALHWTGWSLGVGSKRPIIVSIAAGFVGVNALLLGHILLSGAFSEWWHQNFTWPRVWALQLTKSSAVAIFNILVPPVASAGLVGSSRVDLQACKLEYSIVSPK